jgi:hypothetical protein
MGNIGILELIIILTLAIAYITVIVFAIKKLVRSKITPNQKIGWIFGIFFFQFIALIVFWIYHDFYLSPELRAN